METLNRWYVLQATYKRNINLTDVLQNRDVEFYIPLKVENPEKKNSLSRDALLIFIRSSKTTIDVLLKEFEFLRYQYIYKAGKRKPVTMSEADMKRFIKENKAQYKAQKSSKTRRASKQAIPNNI